MRDPDRSLAGPHDALKATTPTPHAPPRAPRPKGWSLTVGTVLEWAVGLALVGVTAALLASAFVPELMP